MKKEFYDKLARPFETDEKKKNRLIRVNNIITKAVYIVYPAMLAVLAVQRDLRFLRAFLVPLVTFVAVTIFRKACNAPRPYEVWDSPPLIPKDTKRNSFPSRHVFSVYIIAMTALYVGISSELANDVGRGGTNIALLGIWNGMSFGAWKDTLPGAVNGDLFFLVLGIVLMVVGVFLAAVRVIARVHFLKDVIAGAVLGIVFGVLGFFVI